MLKTLAQDKFWENLLNYVGCVCSWVPGYVGAWVAWVKVGVGGVGSVGP